MIIIALLVYLLIGTLFAAYMLKYADNQVVKYEKGEHIEKEDVERLESISAMANAFGEKLFIAFVFLVCMVFWLPMIIFDPPGSD